MPFMRDYKICKKCGIKKHISEYSHKRATGRKPTTQPRCKSCSAEDTRIWKESQSVDRLKDLYLQRIYGVTLQWYQDTLSLQSNCCPLCSKPLIFGGKINSDSPVVDHDHTTGKVRGIICNECNRGLGYFRDNPEALRKAAKYLEEQ